MSEIAIDMAGRFFQGRFDAIKDEIPYDPVWCVSTGYLDHAVHMVKLRPGEEVKSITLEGDDRRIIFVGTQLGTLVVFQRHSNDPNTFVRIMSKPLAISGIIPSGLVGYENLVHLLGHNKEDNLGARLARAFTNLEPEAYRQDGHLDEPPSEPQRDSPKEHA